MNRKPHTRKPFREAWRQYKKSRFAVAALFFLGFMLLLALLADVLANSRPLYCRYNGSMHFPAFSANRSDSIFDPTQQQYRSFTYRTVDWRSLPLESALWAPIPYSPDFLDLSGARLVGPFDEQYYQDTHGEKIPLPLRFRHWLGTTQNGQDVLAGLLHGARISLFIGIFSIFIAALIGIFLGTLAGYFGDYRIHITRGTALLLLPFLFLAYFYGFYVRHYTLLEAGEKSAGALFAQSLLSLLIALLVLSVGFFFSRGLARFSFFSRQVRFPADSLVSRAIEILRAVPILLILISFSVLFKGSMWFVILVIGLTSWTAIARLIRAEMIRIRRLYYLEAARGLGLSERRLILAHALPNGLAPVLVAITFSIAGAIIAESGLSFLNLGVGEETLTWGKLLQKGKGNFSAWWLTLFPALTLFLTVLSFNLIGERLRDVMDPQLAGLKKKV